MRTARIAAQQSPPLPLPLLGIHPGPAPYLEQVADDHRVRHHDKSLGPKRQLEHGAAVQEPGRAANVAVGGGTQAPARHAAWETPRVHRPLCPDGDFHLPRAHRTRPSLPPPVPPPPQVLLTTGTAP